MEHSRRRIIPFFESTSRCIKSRHLSEDSVVSIRKRQIDGQMVVLDVSVFLRTCFKDLNYGSCPSQSWLILTAAQ